MSLLLRLANRLILSNSTHPIDPEDRRRELIWTSGDSVEIWIVKSEANDPDLFCLKFPGTGGRAELAGPHPTELLSPNSNETWAVNPPGYGTSTGSACVKKMAATCDAARHAFAERADGRPMIVTGNSLGCMYALYVAARHPVAGVLLRNPAPVHQLIRGKHTWWNLGFANLIARQVPLEMDAVQNAKRAKAPLLMITSQCDRKVPPKYQMQVRDAYAGPANKFVIPDADHHTPISQELAASYRQAIEEWGRMVLSNP